MPEGHTIHRYARAHREALGGQAVRASSPQGRFAEGARRLDGATLESVEAHGKHLFYRFEPAGTLHVHLGLFGRFRQYEQDPPTPTGGTRLSLTASDGTTLHLAGATIVQLIGEEEKRRIVARLGPDPLSADADPEHFFAALRRRSVGVGQALLDQRAIAGIGNVYRSEILFLAGIHPDTPASNLAPPQGRRVWDLAVTLLHAGLREGRITTITDEDRQAGATILPDAERVYVYGRAGRACRRCGQRIVSWRLGGRLVFACPREQPAP